MIKYPIKEKGKNLIKAHLAGLKKDPVFVVVFISETQKLHLRRIERNSHSFSEHVLIISYNWIVCENNTHFIFPWN